MGNKLTPDQQRLFTKIDIILWEKWDPIGVNDYDVRDEYSAYVPTIFRLALEGSQEYIEDQLLKIERDQMGLAGNPENCSKIASLILKEKAGLKL